MSKSSSGPAQPQKSLGQKPVFLAMGFVSLTLEEARMVNYDTKELKFKLPRDDATSGLTPVSSLLTRHIAAGAWFLTFRLYTPISTPDSPYITLLVKQYPNGRASTHLHNLVSRQTLNVKAIPKLPLIYANKTESDILMKKELDALASYVTKEILSKALPAKLEGDDVKVLVRGPLAMLDAITGAKGAKGWAQGRLSGMLKDLGLTEK
ncbi:unnamed protein product, partial [Aureobasidium pullulans]